MESPTPDYLHDFLEGTLLQEELNEMRERVLEEAAELCVDGETEAEILGSLDAKLGRVEAWIQHSEERAEILLQAEADRADAGRELFLRVSRAIAELLAMPPQEFAALSEEDRRLWEVLWWDYQRLREVWVDKIPPEDGMGFWDSL